MSDEKERERKRDAIARGRADVAAGRVVYHDGVQRWVESWGQDLPPAPEYRRTLRAKIAQGLESAQQGRRVDGEAAFARIEAELVELERS